MTEISFHFNAPDARLYACRLLRKALRRGSPIAVTGSDDDLAVLDRELWSFAAAEFVPHAWAADAASIPSALRDTTVWLVPAAAEPSSVPVHHALVNLGASVPRGFESFERLIEIVPTSEAERDAARDRWRGYVKRGYAITRHEVGAE